ncbi:MAG: alanine racemase [Alphaproteobacteria bacterium]|nr:MAG: alanine racemase [Alphaproteobacteria bacterium]
MAFSGELTIDIAALMRNYKTLDAMSAASCETAVSVKADAYGLGARDVVSALSEEGARRFFVATLDEAITVRNVLPQADIHILNGFMDDARDVYRAHNLSPVLNSLSEIELYRSFSHDCEEALPAIIHFDTGMNRLGLVSDEARILCDDLSLLDGIDLQFIMSHFSSSEEEENPINTAQYKRFKDLTLYFKGVKQSLCNSGGVFLSQEYHLDMTRPGIALYGGCAVSKMEEVIRPVVSLSAPILQIHSVKKGEYAGYNETHCFDKDGHVAIISIGYADGVLRSLANNGALYWRDYKLPIRGRVSMDLLICDLSAVPLQDYPVVGDMVEVLGAHQSIDDLAKDAGTAAYEIITSLGARYKRNYISDLS